MASRTWEPSWEGYGETPRSIARRVPDCLKSVGVDGGGEQGLDTSGHGDAADWRGEPVRSPTSLELSVAAKWLAALLVLLLGDYSDGLGSVGPGKKYRV